MTSRTFVLHQPDHLAACMNFLHEHFGEGPTLEVDIREYDPKRSSEQNRLLWALLTLIAQHLTDDEGGHHGKEWWHFRLRVELGYVDGTIELKSGDIKIEVPYPKSTTRMGKREFSEYYTKVEAWAAERNVHLDMAA